MTENTMTIAGQFATIACKHSDAIAKANADRAKAIAKIATREVKNGATLTELAEQADMSVQTFTKIARDGGFVSSGKRGRPARPESERHEIAQAYVNAEGIKDIAAIMVEYGISEGTMRNYAIDLGLIEVKKREKSDA